MLELKEKLDTSQKAATSSICLKHNAPLKVYCEACHQVICCECAISDEHKTHNYHMISECYPKHHQQLQEGLHQIQQEMDNIDIAISHLDAREEEIVQQGELLTEEINTRAQKVIDHIERSRIRLSQQVDTIVQQKTRTLRAQKQQALKIHTQLKTCQEMIEHNLNEWNQQQILVEKQKLIDKMIKVSHTGNPIVFEPIEKANIKITKVDLVQAEIGTISSNTFGIATLKLLPCFPKESSTATLSLQSQDGSSFPLTPSLISSSLISSTLSSPNDDDVSVKCNVIQTNPGDYNITFIPTRGEHLLTVQVGGVDIPNSPFTITVIAIGDKPVTTIQGLNDPTGITVCANGDIVVAEYGGNCVTIFNNKQGVKNRSINRAPLIGQFNGPFGIAISNDGHILVTDYHRLQKITTDGVFVKSIGGSKIGGGLLEFNWPRGIAVHPTTGVVFVADLGNNRIQVFNGADLSYSHTIRHDNIRMPLDLAVDSEGYLYTTDTFTHSVCKFTKTGQYVQMIAKLKNSSLALYNEHIYITDTSNHRVLIYDSNGKQLHSFGKKGNREGKYNEPAGIAVDTSGYVYVCDNHNNRIVVI